MMIDLCKIRLFGSVDEKPVVEATTASTNNNNVGKSDADSDNDCIQEVKHRSLNESASTTADSSFFKCSLASSSSLPPYDRTDAAVGGSSAAPLDTVVVVKSDEDTTKSSSHHGRPADVIEFCKYTVPGSDATEQSACSTAPSEFETAEEEESHAAFTALRCNYLLVTLSVMLADGLQGKPLSFHPRAPA